MQSWQVKSRSGQPAWTSTSMLFCGTIICSCLVGIGGFPMEMLYRMLIPICFRKSRMRQRNAAAHSLCMWMIFSNVLPHRPRPPPQRQLWARACDCRRRGRAARRQGLGGKHSRHKYVLFGIENRVIKGIPIFGDALFSFACAKLAQTFHKRTANFQFRFSFWRYSSARVLGGALMIQVKHLTKRYGDFTAVDFHRQQGHCEHPPWTALTLPSTTPRRATRSRKSP